mmetsp:Transcript_1147/g.2062  ORF Transcript_1147/g.2062 Transcript_1147/m.2062 type:complete len:212 (+) Transcript_1147:113-748(+)
MTTSIGVFDTQQQQQNMEAIMTAETATLPAKKRKFVEDVEEQNESAVAPSKKFVKKEADPRSKAAREHRLAQNRKAARESRLRKKKMVEELQRSLVFFNKANAVLRTEHEELTRKLLSAHAELSKRGLPIPEASKTSAPAVATPVFVPPAPSSSPSNNAPTQTATQLSLPSMEPGATMQAMANFQQAAAVAMQSVMQSTGIALDKPSTSSS